MRCEDLDALARWAEDEGGLLDEAVWIAVEPDGEGWRMVMAAPLPSEPSDDRRAGFAAATVPARGWTLTPVAAGPAPVLDLPAEVGGLWPLGEGAGLAFDLGSAVVEVPATAWEAEVGAEVELPVRRALDPLELTFHGSGPLSSGPLTAALEASGSPLALHHNWVGSGQRFGAALIKDAIAPKAVTGDVPLRGAWRVTAADAPAEDPGGVWLIGQSLDGAAYVTLQRTERSAPALVAALVNALSEASGLTWASSGNALVALDGDALDAWLAAL